MAKVLSGVNQLGALLSVVIVDVVLAGDNAIVVGLAAAGLPIERRRRIIVLGIAAATILRILLAYFAVQLLAIIGMTLAGGVLLLWVSWKMYREFREMGISGREASTVDGCQNRAAIRQKSAGQALTQIVLADVSMSLDNVLAVAGIARDHFELLAFGLVLTVALMVFPEMDPGADVPEITEACWGILGKSPESVMCATSRMVVKRKGAAAPAVVACTLLPYDPRFELGRTLAEAGGAVPLNHPHCAKFCVLGGGACSRG